jgi:hypothetical protein
MSHHGAIPPDMTPEERAALLRAEREMSASMRKIFGEFPDGKLNPSDEGALAVMIGHEGQSVVMRFPKPVACIGFTPEQALGIAETLISHARKLGLSVPLVLRIGGDDTGERMP